MKYKIPESPKLFWRQGYFKQARALAQVAAQFATIGSNPNSQALHNALARADFLTRRGKKHSFTYIQKYAATVTISPYSDILPEELLKTLSADFSTDLEDLRHNYRISGTCTAFLLRKILEKLLYIALAKNGQETVIQNADGSLVGLKTMLTIATTTKVKGRPYMTARTAKEVQGIKFLGDTAAHNPLTNVAVKTIDTQLAFIITAYSELASKL